jgi:hypothetical protein
MAVREWVLTLWHEPHGTPSLVLPREAGVTRRVQTTQEAAWELFRDVARRALSDAVHPIDPWVAALPLHLPYCTRLCIQGQFWDNAWNVEFVDEWDECEDARSVTDATYYANVQHHASENDGPAWELRLCIRACARVYVRVAPAPPLATHLDAAETYALLWNAAHPAFFRATPFVPNLIEVPGTTPPALQATQEL